MRWTLDLLKLDAKSVVGDRSGSVAMVFGLMALMMVCMVGGAVDFARWLNARNQTLSAMDTAVLAGARSLQLKPGNVTAAVAAAQKFYAENTKSRAPVTNDTITFQVVQNNTAVVATGNAQINTYFLGLAEIDQLSLLDMSAANQDHSKAEVAVGGNAKLNLEIAMMLDTSGSMSGQKLADLKIAAKDLVDIVVWDDQSQYTSKISLAPFSADVRLPSSWNDAARGTGLPATLSLPYACKVKGNWTTCNQTYNKTPCVVERKGINKYTDVAPGLGNFVMTEYRTVSSCSQPAADEVQPLSNNKTTIKNKIEGLQIGGGTSGHLGTAWAWYTLSPNWNSVFPPAGQAAAYGGMHLQKIAILMTDGEYNEEFDTNGVATGSNGAGSAVNGSSVVQAKALCDGMKAKGITVYTVGFDLGGNQTAINTLTYCATDPGKFYNASSGDQLKQSFRDIALKLTNLYISQ